MELFDRHYSYINQARQVPRERSTAFASEQPFLARKDNITSLLKDNPMNQAEDPPRREIRTIDKPDPRLQRRIEDRRKAQMDRRAKEEEMVLKKTFPTWHSKITDTREPCDPITHVYKDTDEGKVAEYNYQMSQYRNQVHLSDIYTKQNRRGLDPVTHKPLHNPRTNIPPKPLHPLREYSEAEKADLEAQEQCYLPTFTGDKPVIRRRTLQPPDKVGALLNDYN
ncbi:hypothetical protein BLNAU_6740 [Blattamonas nauphoetae]|uniref:Uncharacterized protein n=1 Tax=Blattamonas nauphoetae TaxID=2049346 RepID=A0ABQ9Y3I4_9EUKA|nr:hypothetical protein BLNAU_6740 [Blattamonas nauphoetae]